ncbi:MAG: serine hydrolase [Gemmatimonadetes bacterium]|nr:serine hydrolase [Gemmatimonadota bacterium]
MIGRLVWQSLAQRPGRSLLLLLGYGLGVGVTVALLSIGDALVEQSRDRDLLGGGDLVVVPAGIDLETLKTGGVSSLYFTIDQARYLYREVLSGPRLSDRVRAAAPWIDDALLYLDVGDTTIAVAARGQIPSRSAALGVSPVLVAGAWEDSESDARWMLPSDSVRLAEIDAFHVPTGDAASDSTWAEWHYFNVLAPDESYWLYLTFLVGGRFDSGEWGGQLLANLVRREGGERRFEGRFEPRDVQFSTERPDVGLGSSAVQVRPDGTYSVRTRVPAADGGGDSLVVSLLLRPEPRGYLPPVDVSPGDFTSGYVVPVLRGSVAGSLCVARVCSDLEGASAYHDHNWGVWRQVTWDWGVAHAGDLSILYGGVQRAEPSDETRPVQAANRFLFAVDSLGLRGVLPVQSIRYEWPSGEPRDGHSPSPRSFILRAGRAGDSLVVRVLVDHARVTPRDTDGALFHQMRGSASLSGRLLGIALEDSGAGFFETWTSGEVPPARTDLAAAISDRLRATGAEYGVAYRDLETGEEILLNPDSEFHAASMMKVPVMVRLFRMADARQLELDASIEVRNDFTSIYDGSPYSLTRDEDSDSTLYARIGATATPRELIDLMIRRSSNLATNILIGIADPDSIASMLAGFGAQGMKVRRGVEDIPAYRNGLNNTTTARGLLDLYTALAGGSAASPSSTRQMLDILVGQEFNDAIPAGLPAGVPVAHKTGWITSIDHDGGIVFPPDESPYVLVVLTSGVEDRTITRDAAAEVSQLIWEARLERAGTD